MRPETKEPEMRLVRLLEDDPNWREQQLPYSQRFNLRETWQNLPLYLWFFMTKNLSKQTAIHVDDFDIKCTLNGNQT